jgi:hypothetical protein
MRKEVTDFPDYPTPMRTGPHEHRYIVHISDVVAAMDKSLKAKPDLVFL